MKPEGVLQCVDHTPCGGAMKVIACIEDLVVIKLMPS